MPSVAVLLRGVNVGPGLRVTSADLRGAAADAGFPGARALLNSGNLVIGADDSEQLSADDVARLVQEHLEARLGQEVATIGLSSERLDSITNANPFTAAARDDPARLQVHVPFGELNEAGVARLDLANAGRELLSTAAGVLYVHYTDGIGRSKLTSKVIDTAVGVPTTARNWNTIRRLRAACAELSSS